MRLKVLLVLDDPAEAPHLTGLLQEQGHRVLAAVPSDALDASQHRGLNPDLVLLSLGQAAASSLEAARRLQDPNPLPVVLLCKRLPGDLERQAAGAGVYAVIKRSLKPQALGPALEVAWRNFSRVRQLQEQARELKSRLKERKLLERAKGILMEREQIGEEEAMGRLRREADQRGVPLIKLAEAVTDAAGLLPPAPGPNQPR